MPRVSSIEGLRVIGRKGKLFGRVEHVLFSPEAPRVVGFEVRPPALGYVIERKPRYLLLEAVERTSDGFDLVEEHARKRPDFSWDESAVWVHMPVLGEGGRSLGYVRDVEFDLADGSVRRLLLSRGAAEDVAIGRAEVAGCDVVGFDGEAVLVTETAVPTSGGTARQVGHGVAIAKLAAEETARQAVGGVVKIAKVVKKSGVTKQAARGWKALKDTLAEGWSEED